MIHFSKERYKRLSEDYDLWWENRTNRPILKHIDTNAYKPDRPQPKAPVLS